MREQGKEGITAVAAVLREQNAPLKLEPIGLDEPRPDEIVVRIAGVGVCHTDLSAITGTPALPLPAVLGHEGAGVVEQTGEDVATLAPGDAVVLSFDSCGACSRCRAGHPAYCERFADLNASGSRPDGSTTLRQDGRALHGSFCGQSSFATHAIASARNAVRVESDLALHKLGPLGCSLQTGAGAVLQVARPQPGFALAVFGAGAVGLAAVMAARIAGCGTVIAVEPDAARRALAEELGATHAINPDDGDAARAVRAIARGGVDVAIDAVGAPHVIDAAVRALASPGTCLTLGFRGSPNPVTLDQGRLLYGRALAGVIEGDVDPQAFIPELIDLHRAGRFPFERLITEFPFEAIDEAVAAARSGAAIKPVLVMDPMDP